MALLSNKSDIFARGGRKYEIVKVPELGEGAEVRVQSLTGREWEDYERSLYRQVRRRDGNLEMRVDNTNRRAKLVAACVVDEDGQLVFSAADVIKLSDLDAGVLDRIYDVCTRLCGQDAEAVAEAEENFGSSRNGPSDSGSPPNSAAPSTNSYHEYQPAN